MQCPRCNTILEAQAATCWMCHSPLAWSDGTPAVTGDPVPVQRDPDAEAARRAAASRMSRYAAVLVIALVLLVIGGAVAYRTLSDNSEKVARDDRGFVILKVNGVKLTFPDRPQSKSFNAEGRSGEVRVLNRSGAEPTTLGAVVVDVPDGASVAELSDPKLAAAIVQSMSGVGGARVSAVNQFQDKALTFFDLSGSYDQAGKSVSYSMRMIAGHGKAVILVGAGSAGLPAGWVQLRDEVRIPER